MTDGHAKARPYNLKLYSDGHAKARPYNLKLTT